MSTIRAVRRQRVNIHRYKKNQFLPHRKHSVLITKSNWLLLLTGEFILRIIQRNSQIHYVICFGYLTPKGAPYRLSRNVGKKLPLLANVMTQKSAVLFTEIRCNGIMESFLVFQLLGGVVSCSSESYAYWTVHRLDSWIKRDQLDVTCFIISLFNPLTPDDPYRGRTAPLTSKRCILYIYSTNIGTEYFKRGIYSPFFPLQNAVCFIILTYLVPVLFTFYIFIQQI